MKGEADIQVLVSDDEGTVGVFLYVEDENRRNDFRALLRSEGAGYAEYPRGDPPARIAGRVAVSVTSVTVLIGKAFVTCPMAVPPMALKASQAVLYFTEQPFDIGDMAEASLLAATLALDVMAVAEVW